MSMSLPLCSWVTVRNMLHRTHSSSDIMSSLVTLNVNVSVLLGHCKQGCLCWHKTCHQALSRCSGEGTQYNVLYPLYYSSADQDLAWVCVAFNINVNICTHSGDQRTPTPQNSNWQELHAVWKVCPTLHTGLLPSHLTRHPQTGSSTFGSYWIILDHTGSYWIILGSCLPT